MQILADRSCSLPLRMLLESLKQRSQVVNNEKEIAACGRRSIVTNIKVYVVII